MNTFKFRTIVATLLVALLATAAYAEPRSDPDPQTRAEKLATVPGLTQAQRDDIIRIENESREAHRALMDKARSDHQKLRDETIQKLRTALGDKAYANYVTWKLEQRGQHRRERRHERMGHRSPPGTDEEMQAPADE